MKKVLFTLLIIVSIVSSFTSCNKEKSPKGKVFVEQMDNPGATREVLDFFGEEFLTMYQETFVRKISNRIDCPYKYADGVLTVTVSFETITSRVEWINKNSFKIFVGGKEIKYAIRGSEDDNMKIMEGC